MVAKGFIQKCGEDYDETFAPVFRYDTIRVVLSIAAFKRLHVEQLDIKFKTLVPEGVINMEYCPLKEMIADILTKPLPRESFEKLHNKMNS